MQASATAGIEFYGAAMRYSEVEHYGRRYRLLRLGDCDFEFDVSEALFKTGEEKYLEIVNDAVAEIFLGTTATRFRMVVHPQTARVFNSIAETGTEEPVVSENVAFESAMLHEQIVGTDGRDVLRGAEIIDGGEPRIESLHVTEIGASVRRRFDRIVSGIPDIEVETISSSLAVSNILQKLSRKRERPDEFELSIGLYETCTEFTLLRDGQGLFAQHREETDPGDVAYFALHVLNLSRKTKSTSTGVQVYGTEVSDETMGTLETVFGRKLSVLNPIPVMDLNTDQFDENFRFESFVACLGAAL